MFARKSFVLLLLAVGGATCSLYSAEALSAEPIGVGDRVVTVRRADLKRGTTRLATVEAGTELVATAVQGDWVGIEVQRDGGTTTGWIQIGNLRRIATSANNSGKAITAAEIQRIVDALNALPATSRSANNSGKAITAAEIRRIVDALNALPATSRSANNSGKAITTATEFRRSLDALLAASHKALTGADKKYEPLPYVAFSLKVARRRIEKAGDDFRSTDPDIWRLAGINKVRGFVHDRDNDDLILVGAIESDRAPLTLDDLVVALRARLRYGEWPLVSIDPTPDTEKTQLQNVRFEGGIRDTAFGVDLLAADYELKGMGLGFVKAGIIDFASWWDLTEAAYQTTNLSQEKGARFWFYPINSEVKVREGVCAIEGLTVGVFTEVLWATIDGKPVEDLKGYKDATNDAFAKQVSRRFAELARNHYAFRRLHGLEELVGLSKALEQLEPRPELSWWLKEYRLSEVASPKQLPMARRRSQDGRRFYMEGGVHLTALALKLKRGNVSALRQAVLSTRPGSEALSWAFKVDKWVIPLGPGQVSPETVAPLFAQAVFLHTHERYAEALALYDRILQAVPDYADAWNNKGVALGELGRWEEAIECLDRAIKLKPDLADAWDNRGNALGQLGRHEEALDCFERATKLKPDLPDAWWGKVRTLVELGRSEEALDCFDEAIKVNPEDVDAWHDKGATLANLGRLREALDCFERATKLKPDYALAWYNKGRMLEKLARHEEALECFERATKLKPDYAEAWNERGNAVGQLARHEEALECFERATKLKPDFTGGWNNKGAALLKLGRPEEALDCFERVTRLKPDDADAWNNKGVTLGRLGRSEEAIECFDRVIKLKPDDAMAWHIKGSFLSHLNRSEEALDCIDRAIKLKPDDAEAWNFKGALLFGLKRYGEGKAAFARAAKLGHPDAQRIMEIIRKEGH